MKDLASTQSKRIEVRSRVLLGKVALFALFVLLCTLLSLLVGRYPAPYVQSPQAIFSDPMALNLVVNYRLPRILLSLLLGATLSASGVVLQMIFRNPLVEPGFLGVSQGAAFGASLAIIFLGGSLLTTEIVAALFGILGLFLSVFLARRLRYGGWVLRLILAGIAVSALFSAGVGVLKYLADPLKQLPEITFWLLGGLWGSDWHQVIYVVPFVLPALFILYLIRWRLNILTLDESTAFSLGVRPGKEKMLVLALSVIPVAVMVSVAGIVGWVGLIIPHISRKLVGANSQFSFPASLFLGALFCLFCDTIARTLLWGEIPLGILTSLIGAFIFLLILTRPSSRGFV
ncbi:MAG: iron ABC transporter permease [Caldiserica bacterium]|nr:iron ABC transporter permease [Caldisericota bacterium]